MHMLMLNASKTEVLLISSKHQLQTLRETTEFHIGDEVIHPATYARNIGVIFDSTLSMVPHVSKLASSLNFHLRNISRIRPFLTRNSAETLIHALISSRLDYANGLLINMPTYCLRPLQLAQNTAARIVVQVRRYDHITPVLRELHWLPVEARILFKTACMNFKAVHDLAPSYICDLIVPYSLPRDLRSSSQRLLSSKSYNCARYGKRAFSVAAPILWNALPSDLRLCDSFECFKRKLKTYLFNSSYA